MTDVIHIHVEKSMRIELQRQIFRSPSGACPIFMQVQFENGIARRDAPFEDELATLLRSSHKRELL